VFDRDANIEDGPALLLEVEFLRRLAACMRAGTLSANRESMASGRIDVVRRVEQHLLDDLATPQTVNEFCRIADTSRRTLEYSFKDYFGTSPKRFIKALKLNAARDDLLAGSYGSEQVVEIASGLGFTHMGQFSTDYRHMFGEKPSDTLRRNA
jgi:AraC family ethanolamine operon transcriptional activator